MERMASRFVREMGTERRESVFERRATRPAISTGIARQTGGLAPLCGQGRHAFCRAESALGTPKLVPQLFLRALQHPALLRGQMATRPIYVKGEHRHRRTIGLRLAPLASLRRTLERCGDPSRIFPGKHPSIQIECVAFTRHLIGPACCGSFAFRHGATPVPPARLQSPNRFRVPRTERAGTMIRAFR